MTVTIDGKAVAATVIEKVKQANVSLQSDTGTATGIAVVIVGDDAASHAYVNSKSKMAKSCGFTSVQHTLPADTSQEELAALVGSLNDDTNIHGILVQLPLPRHLDSEAIIQSIRPEKDVDGLHVVNAGKLATGDMNSGLVSCTPAGSMLLVRTIHGDDLSGKTAVVVGRSNLFGKPMGQLLLNANATVTMAHSRSPNLEGICREADILVVAVGRAEMVKASWLKSGCTVIDVGINRVPDTADPSKTRLVGDVERGAPNGIAAAFTPVPGGVGPMTIAMLMANTVIAAFRSAGKVAPRF